MLRGYEELTYFHTPDMGEISGFGGDYELTCQNMLDNGVNWLQAKIQENIEVDLKIGSIPNVFGLIHLESEDAEELSKAAVGEIDDLTGAMHHAVMSRLFYISNHGWDQYCKEVREYQKDNPDD